MNPKLLRFGMYMIGTMLATLGAADDVLAATGVEDASPVLPSQIAHACLAVGAWLVGYAKTAKSIGDIPLGEIEHESRGDA